MGEYFQDLRVGCFQEGGPDISAWKTRYPGQKEYAVETNAYDNKEPEKDVAMESVIKKRLDTKERYRDPCIENHGKEYTG